MKTYILRLCVMIISGPAVVLGGPMLEVERILVQSQGDRGVYSVNHQEVVLSVVVSNAARKIYLTTTLDAAAYEAEQKYLSGTNTPNGMSETQLVSMLQQSRLQSCVGIEIMKGTQFAHVSKLLAALKAAGVRYVKIHCGSEITIADLSAINPEVTPAKRPIHDKGSGDAVQQSDK